MTARTRFDPLLRLRERQERDARRLRDAADARAAACVARVDELDQTARRDAAGQGDISLFEVAEHAHGRTLRALQKARAEVETAEREVQVAQASLDGAHRNLETLRRLSERKLTEQRREAERREGRALDELATLRSFRRG